MDLIYSLARLDQNHDLHIIRILILLSAFESDDQYGRLEGLTKLAKLDFLLRYPIMLTRALEAKGKPTRGVQLEEHELYSVESEMVRYRFGPWDHHYREYLNILVSKGLAQVNIEGRKVIIELTKHGNDIAKEMSKQEYFSIYWKRARVLKVNFDLKATNLMRFIYDTFPEILTLKSNTPIPT